MRRIILMLVLLFAPIITFAAQTNERTVYVGESRYACPGDSTDCAVLKQRNQEQIRRTQERNEYERRNEQAERREREYRRDYESRRY